MTTIPDYFAAFASRPRPPDDRWLSPAAGAEGAPLRALLAANDPAALSPDAIRTQVEGNLWMLTPEAFRYFLPAFLRAASEHYKSLSIFASELVGALTEPSRDDVVQALDQAAQIPADMGLPPSTMGLLRDQQLEWFDSGTPLATFRARVEGLTAVEGAAVLAFFDELQAAHGADFFDELLIAIDRHWARYRTT
jgi:hypothetical protein